MVINQQLMDQQVHGEEIRVSLSQVESLMIIDLITTQAIHILKKMAGESLHLQRFNSGSVNLDTKMKIQDMT